MNFDLLMDKFLELPFLNLSKQDFLKKSYKILKTLSGCDRLEIWIYSNNKIMEVFENSIKHINMPSKLPPKSMALKILTSESKENIKKNLLKNKFKIKDKDGFFKIYFINEIDKKQRLLLVYYYKNNGDKEKIKNLKFLSKLMVLIFSRQGDYISLKERIKELSCLYKFLQISNYQNLSIEDFLKQIIDIIPFAWQYPEIAVAKIKFDNLEIFSKGYKKPGKIQRSYLKIKGKIRGYLEVGYTKEKPEEFEGPFLKEERDLIENLSFYISFVIERKEAETEKKNLEIKLQQTDKMATIGILSSGIAHELNEPLNTIIGFSDVAYESIKKETQLKKDIEKIKKAGLHMREIIKKLMIFARQEMPSKIETNINDLLKETISFLEKKCDSEKINIIFNLDKNLKPVKIDQGQIRQVFINLILNAIQAMPKGGDLKISTFKKNKEIIISFEDNGEGIKEEDKEKIFLPFFTTKEIGKGTGLGLPVSIGIVQAHNGRIEFESQWKKGSRFDVILPTS